MANNTTHGQLQELEALAEYLYKRIRYELGARSSLAEKSLGPLLKASALAEELIILLSEAKGWNSE